MTVTQPVTRATRRRRRETAAAAGGRCAGLDARCGHANGAPTEPDDRRTCGVCRSGLSARARKWKLADPSAYTSAHCVSVAARDSGKVRRRPQTARRGLSGARAGSLRSRTPARATSRETEISGGRRTDARVQFFFQRHPRKETPDTRPYYYTSSSGQRVGYTRRPALAGAAGKPSVSRLSTKRLTAVKKNLSGITLVD